MATPLSTASTGPTQTVAVAARSRVSRTPAAGQMHEFLQTTINGLSVGSIYALAAIGLTLVYGILRLVNFAHGEYMTLGAYVAFAINVQAGAPLWLAIIGALVVVAAFSLAMEWTIWKPMRARGAEMLQLLLLSLGLSFVMRYLIQFQWDATEKKLDIDDTQAWHPFDLSISRVQLIVMVAAGVLLTIVAVLLKRTLLGTQLRAMSDNFDLAEVSGANTSKLLAITWIVSGALTGLSGVFLGLYTLIRPDIGFITLLSVFAAVILGGIGNAYGALLGGLLLGCIQEWSTIGGYIPATYKEAVGFVVLILVLLIRPQGILGQRRSL
jgi:neutral amino acid transport system permease protein